MKFSKPIDKAIYQYFTIVMGAIFFGFLCWRQHEEGEVKRITVAFFYLSLGGVDKFKFHPIHYRSESHETDVGLGQLVVSGCDSSKQLHTTEEIFDSETQFTDLQVICGRALAVRLWWDVRNAATPYDLVA